MADLTCPFCGECAMPAWRKLCLGWSAKVRCRRCDLKVTVSPLRAITACLPLFFVLAGALIGINGISLAFGMVLVLATLVAFLITIVLYLGWVPLVPGQIKMINPVTTQTEKTLD
jgi:hypothetical protein